jgi:hypothetical protein
MLVLAALTLTAGYGAAATWAYRRGAAVLVLCCVAGLILLACTAVLLGLWYDVPSVSRLVVYMLAAVGPAIVVPTWLLGLLRLNPNPRIHPFPVAFAAAVVGLALGYLLVIYGVALWS